jgi:VIT1/CCC1 family predicted Fe2+/Mn2+ transporter
MAAAVLLAVLSLAAVGAVIGLAAAGQSAPQWITSTALYGLPAAFLLMLVLVADAVAARRRAGSPAGR